MISNSYGVPLQKRNINHLIFLYTLENKKEITKKQQITLCLLSLDWRWRHNKTVEQTMMFDVHSANRGKKGYQICFLQNGINPCINQNVLHVFMLPSADL